MNKGYCIATGRNQKGEPYWISCFYEQYLEHKELGKAYMIIDYDSKGNVIKEEPFNLEALK